MTKSMSQNKKQKESFRDTISRQAAIDEFDGVKVDEENCTEYDIGYNDGIDFAISKLSVLPSAQPEIIYCRECKHYNRYFVECDHESGLRHIKDDHDHCSYAERREE